MFFFDYFSNLLLYEMSTKSDILTCLSQSLKPRVTQFTIILHMTTSFRKQEILLFEELEPENL